MPTTSTVSSCVWTEEHCHEPLDCIDADCSSDAEVPLTAQSEVSFQVTPQLRLVGEAWGEPGSQPVLFLHGGGQTRYSWKGTAQTLAAQGWYAVAIDHRGHGESDWAPDADYSLDAFVRDLQFITSSFHTPPVVVGASLGGLTALLASGESGLELPGLVLVDIAPRIEKEGAHRIASFMNSRPDGFESLEEAAEVIASFTPERKRKSDHTTLAKNLRQGEDGRFRWHWDPRFLSATGPVQLRDRERLFAAARNLEMPTLLVRGRQSDIVSEEGAAEFLKLLPRGEFVDVSDAGHMVAGDRNDIFTNAVATFLTDKLSLV